MKKKFLAVFVLTVLLGGCSAGIRWNDSPSAGDLGNTGNTGGVAGNPTAPGQPESPGDRQQPDTGSLVIKGRVVIPSSQK